MKEEFDSKKKLKGISEIEEFKEIYDYFNSEENLKNCEPFEQLNQKYILLQNRFAGLYHELSNDIESKVYRREYSKGGKCLHRGFYSPSALDLVTGNCNRGRLLKRPPKDSNYDYEYLFDAQNNLICVYGYSNDEGISNLATTELFVNEQGAFLSLIFNSDDKGLSFVSECQYKNGLLTRYENAICQLFYGGKGCTEINVETYEYKNDLLSSFCWHTYMPSIHSLTQRQFTFNRDEEGYLSTYTAKQLSGYQPKTNFDLDSVIYKVRRMDNVKINKSARPNTQE